MTVKAEQLNGKNICIVENGLQLVSPSDPTVWHTVTDKNAVLLGSNIFCTTSWLDTITKQKRTII